MDLGPVRIALAGAALTGFVGCAPESSSTDDTTLSTFEPDRTCVIGPLESGQNVVDTTGAEDSVAALCGGAGSADRSYTYAAVASGPLLLSVEADHDVVLRVGDACNGVERTCANAAGTRDGLMVDLEAGDEVVITVDGVAGASGPAVLWVDEARPELCGDGLDNDFDDAVDCDDPDCGGDEACAPSCPMGVLGAPPDGAVATTVGRIDQHTPACEPYSVAPDHSWSFEAPEAGTYTFSTAGSTFDTVLHVLDGCDGDSLACNDDAPGSLQSELEVTLGAGQEVIVVVDGYSASRGDVVLSVE